MLTFLEDFIEAFGLSSLFDGTVLTASQVIGIMTVGFIGAIFLVLGVRCVMEIIKIILDWRRYC